MCRLREILLVAPGVLRISGAIALRQLRHGEPPGQEPVEPAVAPFAIGANPPGVTRRRIRSASPVKRYLGIRVIAEREIVAEVLEVAPVRWAVAEDFAETEARSK